MPHGQNEGNQSGRSHVGAGADHHRRGGHFGVVITVVDKAERDADLKHWPEIRDLLNTYCGYRLGPEEWCGLVV